jgi:hypothetical protein
MPRVSTGDGDHITGKLSHQSFATQSVHQSGLWLSRNCSCSKARATIVPRVPALLFGVALCCFIVRGLCPTSGILFGSLGYRSRGKFVIGVTFPLRRVFFCCKLAVVFCPVGFDLSDHRKPKVGVSLISGLLFPSAGCFLL